MHDDREHQLVYDWSYLGLGGGISFTLSILIFKFISPILSTKFTSSYSRLSGPKQTEWNDRILSNANATVAIILGIYALWTGDDMRADAVWYDSKLARLACSIIIGYMSAGIVTMFLWCDYNVKEIIGYTFHHLASIYAYYFVSVNGILCYFAMLRLVAEGSTPFVNQRWFYDVTGYRRDSLLVLSNSGLILLSFFIFRMVMLPVFWYQIWQITGTESVAMLGHIQVTVMYIPSIVLDCLNVYWFHKICKGFIKTAKTLLNATSITSEKIRQYLKEG